MPSEPISRPWRRFLRFSVRGLIVLVLLVGVWLGWISRYNKGYAGALARPRSMDARTRGARGAQLVRDVCGSRVATRSCRLGNRQYPAGLIFEK